MRNILEDRSKEDKRNKLIVGIVLVILMLFSTVGYAFYSSTGSDQTSSVMYKDIEFKQTNYGSWEFQTKYGQFETQYNPLETANISVSTTKRLANYYDQVLYFGIDEDADVSSAGMNEILSNVGNEIARQNMACLDEDCEENYPIKNCTIDNIIIFKQENNTRVEEEDKCVYIYGNIEDQIKATDAFIFELVI